MEVEDDRDGEILLAHRNTRYEQQFLDTLYRVSTI
jgi:hypothetical protein